MDYYYLNRYFKDSIKSWAYNKAKENELNAATKLENILKAS